MLSILILLVRLVIFLRFLIIVLCTLVLLVNLKLHYLIGLWCEFLKASQLLISSLLSVILLQGYLLLLLMKVLITCRCRWFIMLVLYVLFLNLVYLVFNMCLTPMNIRHKYTGEWCTFPCGKCPKCCARRASGWSFRLVQQARVSQSALFVTLTYNWSHLEFSKNGFRSLNKVTLQCFFKRLRKSLPPRTVKYYAVGEYGGQRGRPHYHIILYNATQQAVVDAWRDCGGCSMGDVHFGDVREASVGYVLKYLSKDRKRKRFARDDRVPEFALMSKGLGVNYITPSIIGWHKADLLNRMYCVVPNSGGKKISMPRYYKDKLYTRSESFVSGSGHLFLTVQGERERIAAYAIKRNEVLAEEEQIKWIEGYGSDWPHYKAQQDKYLFDKMYRDAEKGKGKADTDDQ